ncbi:MAG: restriction endonuclease subunit S [Streptococcaceae bacterium]|nr:restriction endonuclease subunit S [Streptococcaceae bacterium]
MENWKSVKASEIIDFNPSESISRGIVAKKIAMDKLEPFTRDISDFELSEFKGGSKFRNGDTLLARITPCLENGKTSKVTILDENEVAFGSTEFIVMRAKEGVSDEDYIYYLSLSPYWREIAIKSMVGSSGRQRVQLDVLKNTKLLVPSLNEQVKIGKTLKALDDKIASNKQINHHLAA